MKVLLRPRFDPYSLPRICHSKKKKKKKKMASRLPVSRAWKKIKNIPKRKKEKNREKKIVL